MRIAMLSSISWRTPPRHYGPWEYVTSLLTEALVARGLDVTLFATADSQTEGKLAAICPRPCSEDPELDYRTWEFLHVAHLMERASDFDLIHNQADFPALAFSRLAETPMVATIHGFSSPRILPIFERYNDRVHYVAISEADRSPRLRYAATIHHGIPLQDFPFSAEGGDDVIFYARIHPHKGAVEAIEAAQRARRRLVMAGIVHDRVYFDERVKPAIDGDKVVYRGAVGGAERGRVLGNARVLLHLVSFDEPFGLSVIEALACGTPVIAFRRGAIPELIDHGVTGFLVDTVEEAAACIERASELDRRACRAAAESRFSVDRMADDYVRLYRRIAR
jgi:glycosyltransferase involved in cell wall biosynthesis